MLKNSAIGMFFRLRVSLLRVFFLPPRLRSGSKVGNGWKERGQPGCPMNLIDDASSTILCRFSAEETIWAEALLLRSWIERYGG